MSEVKVNKISPRSGTTVTLGDSGDTIAITSGASLTGFTSTGIDDNATSTAVTIDSSGNVGIGTTSPSGSLTVEGDYLSLRVENTNTSSTGNAWQLLLDDDSTVNQGDANNSQLYIVSARPTSSTGNLIKVLNNGKSNTAFILKDNGNVGIGESSPSAKLHIKSSDVGAFTPFVGGDDLIIEGSEAGLGFMVGTADASNISFGDTANAKAGRINYDHSTDAMRFFTNDTERMRIDSSGNVLVGKTSSNYGTAGVQLQSNGELYVTRNGGNPVSINRLSSDGVITNFAKDGTVVGSIGSRAGVVSTIVLNPASGNGAGLSGGTKCVVPADEAGIIDNDISLGISTHRFKDAYFSGNIYLGGTGSANALDDYEEGTWTPSLSNFSATTVTAKYTKIGNTVHIQLNLNSLSGGASADASVSGLPFVIAGSNYSPFIISTQSNTIGFDYHLMGRVDSGSSTIHFMNNNDNRLHGSVIDGGSFMVMQFSYFVS
jgi:hypothetical protein